MSCILEEAPWWFDDFEEEHCQFCPDKDVCVIEPEEIEDDCRRFRGSASTVREET